MGRTPPRPVQVALRAEVGFGCPVPGCNNPYLEWHHFDPPWRDGEHHEPAGMIALCAEHHRKADAGAFTTAQLREMKQPAGPKSVKGRFDWMRNDLLAVVGGLFFHETLKIFVYRDQEVIAFRRDAEGRLLLNVQMLTTSGMPRLIIEDNDWRAHGDIEDLKSPPSGKLLQAKYANGDFLRIEFSEAADIEALAKRYPHTAVTDWRSPPPFPVTVVEVSNTVAGTEIRFDPRSTTLPNLRISGGGYCSRLGCAFDVG